MSRYRSVFITGANGFIGRRLAQHYRDAGAQIGGIDFNADPQWNVTAGDITQPSQWQDLLAGVDLVLHTAAIVSNTASLDDAWRVNVEATAALLKAATAAGVQRFVQLSSVAANGFDFPAGVTEDYPLRPMGNTYVDTKIASEHAVLACHGSQDMNCTIIRPGDVYGPGSRPWVILPLQMLQRGRFLLPAHGEGVFSPVYIDDLVSGIALAAEQDSGSGHIFTLSGESSCSCAEFFGYHASWATGSRQLKTTSTRTALLLARTLGGLAKLTGQTSELGRGAIDMLSRTEGYSIDKATQLLGYQPHFSLEQGMQDTEIWVREQNYVA